MFAQQVWNVSLSTDQHTMLKVKTYGSCGLRAVSGHNAKYISNARDNVSSLLPRRHSFFENMTRSNFTKQKIRCAMNLSDVS